ncbi:toll/interleukin-1 receptor domain-containing protein [Vibrio splendidus]
MPGKTKRKYVGETLKYKNSFRVSVLKVAKTLPYSYSSEILMDCFQQFYPKKWKELNERYKEYQQLDDFLAKSGKKRRYKHLSPIKFFHSLPIVRKVCSEKFQFEHQSSFNEKHRIESERMLSRAIIHPKATSKFIQEIDPYYLEAYIAAYHQKGTTHELKLEIVNELKKFNTDNTRLFFQKLNSAERNNQIRNIAFSHLQDLEGFVRKRKGFTGKKKQYHIEKSDFNVTPQDLAERLTAKSLQRRKTFDCFLSHSYKDSLLMSYWKKQLNNCDFHIYYDWSSDGDFLKREMVSEFTKIVLKERIRQSHCLLFLQTNNSVTHNLEIKSPWVQAELDYAEEAGKQIYCLNLTKLPPLFSDLPLRKDYTELTIESVNRIKTAIKNEKRISLPE